MKHRFHVWWQLPQWRHNSSGHSVVLARLRLTDWWPCLKLSKLNCILFDVWWSALCMWWIHSSLCSGLLILLQLLMKVKHQIFAFMWWWTEWIYFGVYQESRMSKNIWKGLGNNKRCDDKDLSLMIKIVDACVLQLLRSDVGCCQDVVRCCQYVNCFAFYESFGIAAARRENTCLLFTLLSSALLCRPSWFLLIFNIGQQLYSNNLLNP